MADIFDAIGKDHKAFIEAQHMFFVATAAPGSRINLSPRAVIACALSIRIGSCG